MTSGLERGVLLGVNFSGFARHCQAFREKRREQHLPTVRISPSAQVFLIERAVVAGIGGVEPHLGKPDFPETLFWSAGIRLSFVSAGGGRRKEAVPRTAADSLSPFIGNLLEHARASAAGSSDHAAGGPVKSFFAFLERDGLGAGGGEGSWRLLGVAVLVWIDGCGASLLPQAHTPVAQRTSGVTGLPARTSSSRNGDQASTARSAWSKS